MIEVQIPADRRFSSFSEQQWPDMADLRSTMTDVEEYARTHIMQRPVVAVIAGGRVRLSRRPSHLSRTAVTRCMLGRLR